MPVFVAQGEADTVIPRELLDRTWNYLLADSGAPAYARRDPGGHGITADTIAELGGWIADRLALPHRDAARCRPAPTDVADAPRRAAADPRRGPPGGVLDDPAAAAQRQRPGRAAGAAVRPRSRDLAGVTSRPVGHLGARRPRLHARARRGHAPLDAFLVPGAGEFAHLHPAYDGSLHLALPPALAADAVAKGWAVAHPWPGSGWPAAW